MMFGYIRVSSIDQARPDRTSLQEQERVIRGLAMSKGIGAFDLQIFSDPGVSAAIPLKDRPAGRELLRTAKTGDTIVCSKLDRIFRDALDAQNIYKRFKMDGIDLILYDMGLESVTKDGMSKFFFCMLSAFADLERNRIAERMADGRRAKKEKGGHVGGIAPFGFEKVGEGREAMLKPIPHEQEVIQFVAHLPSNYRLVDVKKALDEKGCVTRTGKPFRWMEAKRILERVERIPQEAL